MDKHIVLVGLMGSGKTTVGRIVAQRLGRLFVDSDDQVEARAGRTVREIWLADGEPAFRRLEAAALREAVDIDEASVIAAAGGVVLDPANRKLLREEAGTVVWLWGDPEVLAARAERGEHRPLLDEDPVGTLRTMAADRHDLYGDVADHVVDVDARSPEELADEIIELVASASASEPGGPDERAPASRAATESPRTSERQRAVRRWGPGAQPPRKTEMGYGGAAPEEMA